MTRPSSQAKPPRVAATQSSPPTAPRPRAPTGHALDAWGLPLSGPARAAVLAEAGLPDPNIDPAAWAGETTAAPPVPPTGPDSDKPDAGNTENDNG